MASILIKPVTTKTSGGFPATISSINPTNSDFLEGTIQTPKAGLKEVRWDRYGRCRDHDVIYNLDKETNEMYDLIDTAKCLGTTF